MSGISARIWPREHSDGRTKLLLVDDHLEVKRWADAIDPKNPQKWRKSPKGAECDWEVKGALLGLNGTEYVPDVKQDRSYQIYKFGFS